MNKGDLVTKITSKVDVSQSLANTVLTAALESIVEAVASGDKVSIAGFGNFEPRSRNAKTARNPATGESVEVPARTVPAFSAGKTFKDRVQAS